ncbi:MAG TPA: hypothetical protein VFZ84_23200 [Burkholderiales bacterium]
MGTSVILVVGGVLCLCVCGYAFYKLMPQEGRPPSRWAQTDTWSTAAALGLLILMLTGISMLVKGVFS